MAMVQVALVGIGMLVLLAERQSRRVLRLLVGAGAGSLCLYYLFAAASAAWSQFPAYSGYRAFEVLVLYLLVFVSLSHCRGLFAAEKVFLLVTVIGLLLDMYRYLGGGIAGLHANSYPSTAAMLAVYCAAEAFQARGKRRTALLLTCTLGLGALLASTCGTSIVAAFCGLMTLGILRRGPVRVAAILLLLVVLAAYAIGLWDDFRSMAFQVLLPGKTDAAISGVSGRMNIWAQCYDLFLQKPLLGYGFGIATRTEINATSSHNMVMDALVNTGIVGGVLMFIGVAHLAREVVMSPRTDSPGATGCLAAFATAFVNTMGSPIWGPRWCPATFTFVTLVSFFTMYVRRRGRVSPPPPGVSCGAHGRLSYSGRAGDVNARRAGRIKDDHGPGV